MTGITCKTAIKVGATGLGALAIAGALASTSVAAGTTYKVSVGATTTGTATLKAATTGTVTFNDTTTSLAATCTKATAALSSTLSTAHAATGIASISKSAFKGCDANGQLPLTIKQVGTWSFNATGPTVNGATPGTLTNIKANVVGKSVGCKFSAAGTVDATYTNATGVIAFAQANGSSNVLVISGQTGNCLGLANNGDKVTFTSNIKLTSTKPKGLLSVTSN